MKKTIAGFLLLLLLVTGTASAQALIRNSKHNFQSSSVLAGTGPIKAVSEEQICVYCHTPHGSSNAAPLWNKTITAANYILYSSDYLASLNPTGTPTGYGVPLQPKAKSKLCLSCHDGTLALGSVLNMPGPGVAGTIAMRQGVTAITTMPTTTPGHLGTSLADDHPVGFLYNPTIDTELVVRAWPWTTPVKLDPNASTGTVECQTCHDPHNNQFTNFLRMSVASAALCTSCHLKTNYASSSHATSAQPFIPAGASVAITVNEYSCRSCHKPHTSTGNPYILRGSEQNTCYDSGCHGPSIAGRTATPANNNIQAEMIKFWNHPANTIAGKHKNVVGGESQAQLGGALAVDRHAECQDCHNPHQMQSASATKAVRGAIRISQALRGTWGVQPTWPVPPTGTAITNNDVTWGASPTVFTRVANATDEYQVCMKCHSGYVTLPTGKRDIAREINPLNSSYHGIVPGGVSNANVTATTTNEPWGTNKRVWCSDCHGSETSTSPRGPHGGTSAAAGPGTANTNKMLVATIASSTAGTPLCLVCHRSSVYMGTPTGSDFQIRDHGSHDPNASGCFSCHMMDLNTSPTVPAGAGGNTLKINAHGWNKRWTYTENVSTSTPGSGQMVDAFIGGFIRNINYTTRSCLPSCHGQQSY